MKKQLVLAAGLAVLAAPAFASKARLQALGEDIYGSQYINDNRNIFLNAANVNEYKDMVTMEWGDTAANDDSAATPRAEGGVFFGHGNLVYGVQLGSESDTAQAMRQAAGLSADQSEEKNTVDVFVGGDAGIKWGASLLHSSSKNEQAASDEEQSAMRARLGVSQGAWNAFANVSLKNEAEVDGGNEFKGKTGYQIGGGYLLNDYNIFGQYQSLSGENAADDKIEVKRMILGVGRITKLNDKANLFTKIAYQTTEATNDALGAGNNGDLQSESNKTAQLPVTVGLEYDAASWLTLRGSVAQNVLISKTEGEDEKTIDSTVVAMGASLKFGDLVVDGMIGNSATEGAGAGDPTTTTGENTSTGGGVLRTDTLMSRVAVTYKF
jgi:hypothetical protein